MNKKVVFGAFFHWNSYTHVGSHHYAKEFARQGFEAAYISNPISLLNFLFSRDLRLFYKKFNIWRQGGKLFEKDNIWEYIPLSLFPTTLKPFFRSSWIVKNRNRFTFPDIRYVLKKNKFGNVDILFLDEAYKYLLDKLSYERSVYRIHDDITYLRKYPALFKVQEEVIRCVDLVVSPSRAMESLAKDIGAKQTLYLPNGVEFDFFDKSSDNLPPEYKSIRSPRVIYLGRLDYMVDTNLIEYAAKKLPNVSFVLIGRARTDLSILGKLENIYILGERNYKVLPDYLNNANVGIIPWDNKNSWIIASHPNKLYMYMACGLPVVSTKWNEIENIESPAYLALDRDEFIEMIKVALCEKNREKYIKFARKNTWNRRFEKLLKRLYCKSEP